MKRGTSARKRQLRGNQEPRIRVADDYDYTYGGDAAEMAGAYGLMPDPWQQTVLDDWLAYDDDGTYAHDTCGLAVPRQNGKNGVLEVRELYGAAVEGDKILHTAHEVKTARKAFLRLCSFFENESEYPEMAEIVKAIRKTNGQEAIELTNGGSIEFSARSKGAARGFTVDVVVCDEAQELTDDQLEALMPTSSAGPLQNSQLILLGTPPGPTTNGDVFPRTRRNALSSEHGGTNWIEWSVDEIGDVSDESRWEETNPALGYRLTRKAVEKELKTMSPDGFARERLGWWASDIANACFDPAEWDALKADFTDEDIAEQASWKRAYGVKFSADGKRAAIAIAIWKRGVTPHVEVLEHRSTKNGIQWAADWLTPRCGKVSTTVVDGKANALDLYNRLVDGGVTKRALRQAKPETVTAASSMFLNAVTEGALTHNGQPALDDAVKAAEKRDIGKGGGFGFQSGNETDITPLEAACLALWGVRTTKRDPNRKAVVG